MTEKEYRQFIREQKIATDAHVERRLGQLCADLGYERDQWRRWRFVDRVKGLRDLQLKIKFDNEQFAARMHAFIKAMQENKILLPQEFIRPS